MITTTIAMIDKIIINVVLITNNDYSKLSVGLSIDIFSKWVESVYSILYDIFLLMLQSIWNLKQVTELFP